MCNLILWNYCKTFRFPQRFSKLPKNWHYLLSHLQSFLFRREASFLETSLFNQWPCCHGRLTWGSTDDNLISFCIWSGKRTKDGLNEIPSILMKYNYILLINHLKINMSLLSEPCQNLSFYAKPQYILSCSDFYKFSHLCPIEND